MPIPAPAPAGVYNGWHGHVANPAPILRVINTVGNLLGATVAFFYLRVIDPGETNMMQLGLIEIAYFPPHRGDSDRNRAVVERRWLRPIARIAAEGPALPEPHAALARRRALLFPYFLALVSFGGWTMAGLIFAIVLPFAMGHFSARAALRGIAGVTVIAGVLATAFVFLADEHSGGGVCPSSSRPAT